MQYTVYTFTPRIAEGLELGHEVVCDLLADLLSAVGFDSYEHQSEVLLAYIPTEQVDEPALVAALKSFPLEGVCFDYKSEILPEVNWNEEWEHNYFQPISINGGACVIRAPFHLEAKDAQIELIISPKMAFGTGNHETTALIIGYLMQQRLDGLRVLDMGCGTGILGILALKQGASYLTAIDIDEWAYHNVQENAQLNAVQINEMICSDASALAGREAEYDLILANITRNILLEDMPAYVSVLRPGGRLILSGFYVEDAPLLVDRGVELGLQLLSQQSHNRWTMLELGR